MHLSLTTDVAHFFHKVSFPGAFSLLLFFRILFLSLFLNADLQMDLSNETLEIHSVRHDAGCAVFKLEKNKGKF